MKQNRRFTINDRTRQFLNLSSNKTRLFNKIHITCSLCQYMNIVAQSTYFFILCHLGNYKLYFVLIALTTNTFSHTLTTRHRRVPGVVALRHTAASRRAIAYKTVTTVTSPAHHAVNMTACLRRYGAVEGRVWRGAVQGCGGTNIQKNKQCKFYETKGLADSRAQIYLFIILYLNHERVKPVLNYYCFGNNLYTHTTKKTL